MHRKYDIIIKMTHQCSPMHLLTDFQLLSINFKCNINVLEAT